MWCALKKKGKEALMTLNLYYGFYTPGVHYVFWITNTWYNDLALFSRFTISQWVSYRYTFNFSKTLSAPDVSWFIKTGVMQAQRGRKHERANLPFQENWKLPSATDWLPNSPPKGHLFKQQIPAPPEKASLTSLEQIHQFFWPLRPLLIINHMVSASQFGWAGLVCLSCSLRRRLLKSGSVLYHSSTGRAHTAPECSRLDWHALYRWMKESNQQPSVQSCCSKLKNWNTNSGPTEMLFDW